MQSENKIEAGDYVDLAKLLPKDRVKMEDDNRLEMVNKGGYSYWVPMAERESTLINSFNKWEQAFRVYMNIYVGTHPGKATELLQYNHVIEIAATSFCWENVYKYDRNSISTWLLIQNGIGV